MRYTVYFSILMEMKVRGGRGQLPRYPGDHTQLPRFPLCARGVMVYLTANVMAGTALYVFVCILAAAFQSVMS